MRVKRFLDCHCFAGAQGSDVAQHCHLTINSLLRHLFGLGILTHTWRWYHPWEERFFKFSPKDMFIDLRERERERERQREREIPMWDTNINQLLPLHPCPDHVSDLQRRYVPWLGIEPTTFWCMEWCSQPTKPHWPGLVSNIFLIPKFKRRLRQKIGILSKYCYFRIL